MISTTNKRRLVTTAAAVVLTAATASTAFAEEGYGDYSTNGVRIRSCGSTACTTVYGLGYVGDGLTDHCWVYGQDINGDYYWAYNTDHRTGVTGYSADYYITITSGGVWQC